MSRQKIILSASIAAHFGLSFALLYWFAGDSSFCARSSLRSTFTLSLACTIWDLLACTIGSLIAQRIMKLRTAAPLLAAATSGAGLASMPFWIYRGYGHFLFEGTPMNVSCYFTEGYGLAFPFVIAPALGLLTLIHSTILMRTRKVRSIPQTANRSS